jgi:hypothetical protein
LEFGATKPAREWARRLNKIQPGVATLQGSEVRFRRPITVMISLISPEPRPDLVTKEGDTLRFNRGCELSINLPPKEIAAGTQIEFSTAKAARDSVSSLPPEVVRRRGRFVTFPVPATFVFNVEPEQSPRKSMRNVQQPSSAANPKKPTHKKYATYN